MSNENKINAKRSTGARVKARAPDLKEIRRLVADYIGSEGCSCCEGSDHKDHQTALAKALRVPRYSDDSGNDFPRFRTQECSRSLGLPAPKP